MLRSKSGEIRSQVLDEDHFRAGLLDRTGQPLDLHIEHHGPVPQK